MRMSEHGRHFLKEREGLELEAYPDPATHGEPWTIGIGHTSAAGEPKVKKGMEITEQQAYEILDRDLVKYENCVNKYAGPNFTQNQFDAMVSLCFNIGTGNFKGSSVAKRHKAKDYGGAADAFMMWDKAAGRVNPGLVHRRELEKALYEKKEA